MSDYEQQLNLAIQNSLIDLPHENDLKLLDTQVDLCIKHKLLKEIYKKLNKFQKNIFGDCIKKESAGLSLPLGSGKTLLSLLLGLYFTMYDDKPILVVVSKSLIASWIHEIKKFFGDRLKYQVIHQNVCNITNWKLNSDCHLILTTADVLKKYYKELNIHEHFTEQIYDQQKRHYITHYNKIKTQLNHVKGGGIFYSIEWGCLIVDEVQKFTNIETLWCKSISAINSNHRWLLSGTMFDDPKVTSIFGYYMILNDTSVPRNLPEFITLVRDGRRKFKGSNFKGLNKTLIKRDKNVQFKPPIVNEHIISYNMNEYEGKIYTSMKNILNEIKGKADKAKLLDDVEGIKKFNSYKLVIIGYLRLVLVCPLLTITSISLNVCDVKKQTELSDIIMKEFKRLELDVWLKSIESVKSTRIKKTIEAVNKHPDRTIVIFANFKSYLDILQYYLKDINRPIYRMTSNMSINKRGELIKEFEKSKNGILLLSYQLGAEGLNLQFSSIVMITDFWWNSAKTQQAIGRIYRFGQLAKEIDVYFFTANTGIEKVLFEKQKDKIQILNELAVGTIKTKVTRIKIDDIIKLINMADNKTLFRTIKYY